MFPFIISVYMGWFLCGFLMGGMSLSLLRSLKKRNEGASLTHALYWHLPMPEGAMKLSVPSHIREYI